MTDFTDAKEVEITEAYRIYSLTRELAKEFQEEITEVWNLVPLSDHGVNDILAEEKEGKSYLGKWQHSLIMLSPDRSEVYGFIVGYERGAERNDIYPVDTLHLKSLSISQEHQKKGLGRKLVNAWLKYNKELGYLHLEGKFAYSTQTNGADFNKRVQSYYESVGFRKVAKKTYSNKTDFVYYLND